MDCLTGIMTSTLFTYAHEHNPIPWQLKIAVHLSVLCPLQNLDGMDQQEHLGEPGGLPED